MNPKKPSWLVSLILAVAFSLITQAARATVYEIGLSTPAGTPVIVAVGPGTLNDIEISSGVATTFCAVYASTTSAAFTNAAAASQAGTLVNPRLGHVNAVATAPASFASKQGRAFLIGAIAICNVAVQAIVNVTQ